MCVLTFHPKSYTLKNDILTRHPPPHFWSSCSDIILPVCLPVYYLSSPLGSQPSDGQGQCLPAHSHIPSIQHMAWPTAGTKRFPAKWSKSNKAKYFLSNPGPPQQIPILSPDYRFLAKLTLGFLFARQQAKPNRVTVQIPVPEITHCIFCIFCGCI